MRAYLERVLLVVGARNAGKSTQLRSMFQDPRLGTNGVIPTSRRIQTTYSLSPDRSLFVRLTSPHEWGESPIQFLASMTQYMTTGRWCAASAAQLTAMDKMPDLPETVRFLVKELKPERIRVAVLSPDRQGAVQEDQMAVVDRLWKIRSCEVLMIDARSREKNGFLLAETFFSS